MVTKIAKLLYVMVITAMLAGGCTNSNTGLVGMPSPILQDIPVPTDFKIVNDRSRSWTDGTLRFADMLYKGRADNIAIQKFYSQQMPTCHWIAQTEMFAQGRSTMDYVKSGEKCRITVYKEGMLSDTYIQIAIWPNRPNARIDHTQEK